MGALQRSVAIGLGIACVVLSSGLASAWQARLDGGLGSLDEANDVAAHPSGDVVVGGALTNRAVQGLTRFDAIVIRHSAVDGSEVWRYTLPLGDPAQSGTMDHVAIDAAGDVIAAGAVSPTATASSAWRVVKLSGASGDELWQYAFETPRRDLIRAMALDASGDVLLTGFTDNDPLGSGLPADMTVAKVSGVDGSEIWRVEVTGTGDADDLGTDQGSGIAANASGDVLVAGKIENDGPDGEDVVVAKLSGADGTEIWRREIAGTEGGRDDAEGMALHSSGDPIVIAEIRNIGTSIDFGVYRIAETDGTIVWGREIDGGINAAELVGDVAVDPAGDVVVVGGLQVPTTGQDFSVLKLSGADGTDVWHSDLSGALGYADWATDVAIDAAGDVVALGRIWHFNLGDPPFGIDVVKLAGADGSTIWQDAIAATGQWALSIPKEIALDADGNVLAVGDTEQMCTNNDYAVVRLDGGDGSGMDNDLLPTTCLLSAKSLRVRDRHPDRQRLVLKSKHLGDRSIAWHSRIPIPSSGVLGADPTIYGATLEVVNRASGESTIIPLPASNWSATERTPTIGFRETVEYQDRQGVLGPCQRVRLRPQQRTTLDAKCKGAIGLSLDEPSQGQLMLRLTLGGPVKARYCMEFGGDVKKDQAGAFVARSALAPTDCD